MAGHTRIILLVSSLALAILFAMIAGVFHGYVKTVTDKSPDINSTKAQSWVRICTWLAVLFGIASAITGYMVYRSNRTKAEIELDSSSK